MHPAQLQPSSSLPSCLHPHVAKQRPRLFWKKGQRPSHSSRKRGTVPRPVNRIHRPESRFGNDGRDDTIRSPERVSGQSVLHPVQPSWHRKVLDSSGKETESWFHGKGWRLTWRRPLRPWSTLRPPSTRSKPTAVRPPTASRMRRSAEPLVWQSGCAAAAFAIRSSARQQPRGRGAVVQRRRWPRPPSCRSPAVYFFYFLKEENQESRNLWKKTTWFPSIIHMASGKVYFLNEVDRDFALCCENFSVTTDNFLKL